MSEIIKEIRKIIGTDYCADLKVSFYGDMIVFHVYETEIPINFNRKGEVYIDPDQLSETKVYVEVMKELTKIMKLLENNKEILKE
jgi:hypothetical protein